MKAHGIAISGPFEKKTIPDDSGTKLGDKFHGQAMRHCCQDSKLGLNE